MKLNWYPGHIAKAKKTIESNLKLIDLIVEVRDARIVESSKPEALTDFGKEKSRIVVLNKKDLASPDVTMAWIDYLNEQGVNVTDFSKDDKKDGEKIIKMINSLVSDEKSEAMSEKAIKLMIIGIPNVGKSTVLNQIIRKKTARTGALPGITRGKQWHKIKNKIHILDTPGILLPYYDNEEVGYSLAACEALDINVFPLDDVSNWLYKKLKSKAPENLKERFNLDELPEFSDFLEEVGKKRGALLKGGKIDLEKACTILIKDFNNGKLGRISLENVVER